MIWAQDDAYLAGPMLAKLPKAEARGAAGNAPSVPLTAVRESAADAVADRRGTHGDPSAVPVVRGAQPGEEVSASPANVGTAVRYEITGPWTTWIWRCEAGLADLIARGWSAKPLGPAPYCDGACCAGRTS